MASYPDDDNEDIHFTLHERAIHYQSKQSNLDNWVHYGHDLIPSHLGEIGKVMPVHAIEIALALVHNIQNYFIVYHGILPFVNEIPDDNIDLLRETAACIAGRGIASWADGLDDIPESSFGSVKALGILFKKLARSGYADEVRELADRVIARFPEDGDRDCLEPIVPYSSQAQRPKAPNPDPDPA